MLVLVRKRSVMTNKYPYLAIFFFLGQEYINLSIAF
jgi:hypothetical protein